MPRLGHAARVRAHIRPILKGVQKALALTEQHDDFYDLTVRLDADRSIAWQYGRHSAAQRTTPYDRIPYASKDILVKSHQEIEAKLLQWQDQAPSDREIEDAVAQMQDLGTMAWKLERAKRKQDTGAGYLTLDVDPVTIRLLAMSWEERSSRDEGVHEASLILEKSRFAKVLRKDLRTQVKDARKTLQLMIEQHGDIAIASEEYTVIGSDIPNLSGYRIEMTNGSVRSVSRYSDGPVRWINSDRIALNVELPEITRAMVDGMDLDEVFDHPLTRGLGLKIERTTPLTAQGSVTHEIRTNAWTRERLTAMVLNLATKNA